MLDDPKSNRVAELGAEVEELRDKLEEVEEERERLARAPNCTIAPASWMTSRVLLGPRLVGSLKAWLRDSSARDPLPPDETADLAAAVLRRIVRVGPVGLAVAVLPIVLLSRQNLPVRD